MRIISLSYLAWTLLILAVYLMPRVGNTAALPVALPEQDELMFDVMLDGSPIGTQQVLLKRNNGIEQVSISTSLDVKLLFITVYRYQHENRETWSSGCLQQIEANTDDNGKQSVVRGAVENGALQLLAGDSSVSLPGCVRTFAYWNPELLQSERLLNPQTGKYEPVSFTELGQEKTRVGDQDVPARRVQLKTPKVVIDLWYANENRWIALESETKNGQVLRYERRQGVSDA